MWATLHPLACYDPKTVASSQMFARTLTPAKCHATLPQMSSARFNWNLGAYQVAQYGSTVHMCFHKVQYMHNSWNALHYYNHTVCAVERQDGCVNSSWMPQDSYHARDVTKVGPSCICTTVSSKNSFQIAQFTSKGFIPWKILQKSVWLAMKISMNASLQQRIKKNLMLELRLQKENTIAWPGPFCIIFSFTSQWIPQLYHEERNIGAHNDGRLTLLECIPTASTVAKCPLCIHKAIHAAAYFADAVPVADNYARALCNGQSFKPHSHHAIHMVQFYCSATQYLRFLVFTLFTLPCYRNTCACTRIYRT